MKNYHAVLDVPPSVTPEQLRTRYKQLIRIYHPDRFTSNPDRAYAEERLKEINEAYTVLKAAPQERFAAEWEEQTRPSPRHREPAVVKPPGTNAQPVTALVQMRRIAQHGLVTSGLILAGLAATPLLSSPASPLNQLRSPTSHTLDQPGVRVQTQAAPLRQAPVDWVPVYSPNRRHMILILRQEGLEKLYLRNPNSGSLQAVSDASVDTTSLVWSPDETKLVFVASDHIQSQLYMVDLATTQTTYIAEISDMNQLRSLRWSAGGVSME